MNEISRFTKINGRWFYLDGVIKSIGKAGLHINQGKNAPCSCGSGAKNLSGVVEPSPICYLHNLGYSVEVCYLKQEGLYYG